VSPRRIALSGFRGEIADGFPASSDPAAELARLADPASALRTLHWGRNYLYQARLGDAAVATDVVVKQFRESDWRSRLQRRGGRPGKAEKSFRAASAVAAAGVSTPEPLAWLEAERPGGASIFVCRHLEGRVEARYLLRARNAGREADEFPGIAIGAFLDEAAAVARRLHDAGIWHRDFSIGNLLLAEGPTPERLADLALVDLNRCRIGRTVTLSERLADLSRLMLDRSEDRRRLLSAYFGGPDRIPAGAEAIYERARRRFHGRHRFKNRWRGRWKRLKSWLVPRGTHAHIPPPPEGAGDRDKIVWDALSDQPHSHAGRLGRARVRLADAGDHLRSAAALARAAPGVWSRYRRLGAERRRSLESGGTFPWPGVGVALRPWPADPEALLDAVEALGVRQALLRLHPWAASHDDEEALAAELARRGVELTFALPQNRELVRDRARWAAAMEELAERFMPFGSRFQIGQAINRSKWGVWSYGEYLELAAVAAAALRARGEAELAGPAVIDFEAHATAMATHRRHPTLRFDALASLLYVDRRGAPENRQLGFDTTDKVTLLAAIAESSPLVEGRRQWITEVNWPLREGPHSPAGQSVAVDETAQADYLERFYLLALGSGLVERVFWWQLVARGYGLVDPLPDGTLRRRPAFDALATLAREIPLGAPCRGLRALAAADGADARGVEWTLPDGRRRVAAWGPSGVARVRWPEPPRAVRGRRGALSGAPPGVEVELTGDVRYVDL